MAELETGSQWTLTSERLPEENQSVLVYSPGKGYWLESQLDDPLHMWRDSRTPVYWMPLPSVPEEVNG